jgi:UDP-N-acetylmuramyl pentapeptide phosphotransferase/UDP-N-acetylglucosamine-1-phosphate transferase
MAQLLQEGTVMVKRFHIFIIAALSAVVAAWYLEPTGWLASVVAAGVVSAAMMRYAVKNILAVSYRKRLYDLPGGRRIHTTPTPRLGGLAFAPIICCTSILALALHGGLAPAWHVGVPECLTWISALIFIYMIGTVDDLIGVRYHVKFSAQIVAALLVVASGFWINDLGGLFGVWEIPAAAGIPLTVLFIVGIINALNLIDGMDGLAAGICMIALAIYGVHCFATGRFFLSVVSISALGTVAPFFYCNVRGVGNRRHKLFMGDTGSQTLGLVISVLAVAQIRNSGTELATRDFILALSPLVVPAFDVVHVFFLRMLRGNHPFHPDTTHIHHRLTRVGFTPRQAVAFILCLVAIYVTANMLLAPLVGVTMTVVLDALAWMTINGAIYWLTKSYTFKIKRTETNINAKLLKS